MWGKILGALFGLALLKLPGLLLGIVLGHWFDKAFRQQFEQNGGFAGLFGQQQDEQSLFRYTTFATMGHIAKAAGVVTSAHIQRATRFMAELGLSAAQQKEAQEAFRDGKAVSFPLRAQLQQFYLAYDRNNDKQVNNGTELFGPQSGQGFAELAEFDDNGNGFIDPSDDIWQYLYLWRPNQQLLSMAEAKLGAFSVSSAATPMPLLDKQQHKTGEIQRSGLAFTDDAKPVLVQQIDLVV